jgi:phytoene dehydrogenase-like protein
MKNSFDVLVVGGGHNGLVASCYLAKAGFRVCILERYREVGGAAFTQEIHPGFLLSEGSYVLSLMPRTILQELGAWNGIQLIERNPRFFMPFPDGQSLTAWEEEDRFLEEIAKFSRIDAANYPRYDAFVEKASEVMDKFILRNPPSFAEFAAEFGSTDDARIFQRMILGSAAHVAEYFFESEQMQAVACAFGLIGTFRGPRDPGTAYVKLFHSMGMVTGKRGQWAYVKGAMGAVTQSLKRVALSLGVTIRTNAEVEQICVQNGRATGAVTTSGEEFHAKAVLSNADPIRTYLRMVERNELPDAFVRDVEAIQIASPVMKINLALEELLRAGPGEPPAGAYRGRLYRAEHRLPATRVRRRPPRRARGLSALQRAYAIGARPIRRARGQSDPLDLYAILPVRFGERKLGRTARRDRRPRDQAVCRIRAQRAERGHCAPGVGPAGHRSALRTHRRPYLSGRARARAGVRSPARSGLQDL